jgi:hypothetical protein
MRQNGLFAKTAGSMVLSHLALHSVLRRAVALPQPRLVLGTEAKYDRVTTSGSQEIR